MTSGFDEIAAALGDLLAPIAQAAAEPVSMEQLAEQPVPMITGAAAGMQPSHTSLKASRTRRNRRCGFTSRALHIARMNQ